MTTIDKMTAARSKRNSVRRPSPTPRKPAMMRPDLPAGDGYRRLRSSERLRRGDQCYHESLRDWLSTGAVGFPARNAAYRRPLRATLAPHSPKCGESYTRRKGKRAAGIIPAMRDDCAAVIRTLSPAALAILRAEARATGVSEAVFALRTLEAVLRLAGRRGARK